MRALSDALESARRRRGRVVELVGEPGMGKSRMVEELGEAVRGCPARLVVVSPEVGLAPVALTPAGRAFVDALGAVNIAVAEGCDAMVLVIAGVPVPVRGRLD